MECSALIIMLELMNHKLINLNMDAEQPVNMFSFIKLYGAFQSNSYCKFTYYHSTYHKTETLAFSENYKYITYIKICF